MDYIKSCDILADSFTKALEREKTCNRSRGMGLKPIKSWAMYEDTQLRNWRSWKLGLMRKTHQMVVVKNTLSSFNYLFGCFPILMVKVNLYCNV